MMPARALVFMALVATTTAVGIQLPKGTTSGEVESRLRRRGLERFEVIPGKPGIRFTYWYTQTKFTLTFYPNTGYLKVDGHHELLAAEGRELQRLLGGTLVDKKGSICPEIRGPTPGASSSSSSQAFPSGQARQPAPPTVAAGAAATPPPPTAAARSNRPARRNREEAGLRPPAAAGLSAMEAESEDDYEVVPPEAAAVTGQPVLGANAPPPPPEAQDGGDPQQMMLIIEQMAQQISELQAELARLRLNSSPGPK